MTFSVRTRGIPAPATGTRVDDKGTLRALGPAARTRGNHMRTLKSTAGLFGGGRGRVASLALAGVLLVAMTACSDDQSTQTTGTTVQSAAELLGPENQATGEPVRVGMVSDGKTDAYDNTDELRAAQATAEYFNAHKGGIGGRPIEVVTCEAKGDP